MSISAPCQRKIMLKGVRKCDRPWSCIVAKIIAVGMMASTWGSTQTTADLLSQADRLADKGNGFRAAPLYSKAEKEFQCLGDRRNELYATFGRVRGETETGSYKAARSQVKRDLVDPVVNRDPQLKIRALSLLGTIDL